MIRVAADKTFSDGIALLALAYCFGIATGIFLCSGKDKLKKWGQSSKRGSINLSDLLNSGCEEPLARILTEGGRSLYHGGRRWSTFCFKPARPRWQTLPLFELAYKIWRIFWNH